MGCVRPWEGEGLTWLFWKLKKCSNFEKRRLDCVYLLVKFSIQTVALRVSRRRNCKMYFFLVFLAKCLLKCPSSMKPPLPWKCLVSQLHSAIILFAECSILKFWQCSKYTYITKCSVMLHTASYIFRILASSELCSFRNMQIYSWIFS